MEITLTVDELIAAHTPLQKLAAQDLPPKTRYAVARILRAYIEEFRTADEQRLEVWKRYGEEKNGQVVVPEEKRPQLLTDLKEFLSTSITFTCWQLTREQWEQATMSAADEMALWPFIEEPREEATPDRPSGRNGHGVQELIDAGRQ